MTFSIYHVLKHASASVFANPTAKLIATHDGTDLRIWREEFDNQYRLEKTAPWPTEWLAMGYCGPIWLEKVVDNYLRPYTVIYTDSQKTAQVAKHSDGKTTGEYVSTSCAARAIFEKAQNLGITNCDARGIENELGMVDPTSSGAYRWTIVNRQKQLVPWLTEATL